MLKNLKAKLDEGMKREKEYRKTPNTPEAKRNARIAAIFVIILGLIGAGVTWYEWIYSDTIYIIFPVAAALLIPGGIYSLITGKIPVR